MNAWGKESSANFHLLVQPKSDSFNINPHPEERKKTREAEGIELNCGVNDEFESCAIGNTCTFDNNNDRSTTNVRCEFLNCTSSAGTFDIKALVSFEMLINQFYYCSKMSG